ncbi:MAG: hypothetical protein KDA21_14735 [Phycisphaerales bacterium]|nr:hypothetical protein [Phycisphaerales bacterium]
MKAHQQQRLSEVRELLLRHPVEAHAAFYEAATFGGPSLHFHRRAIGMVGGDLTRERLELIYATLAAWGMHRMGPSGSKMVPFPEFEASVQACTPTIRALAGVSPDQMEEQSWNDLERLFRGIRVMASGTTIVGNSKVMAHLVPDLVPPVDRQYTLHLALGHKRIVNGLDREWRLLRWLLEGLFHPIATDEAHLARCREWMAVQELFAWDTSPMKVVDNLVIGAMVIRGNGGATKGVTDGEV